MLGHAILIENTSVTDGQTVAAEPRGQGRQLTVVVRGGGSTGQGYITDAPIICDWSIFSYLRRTKIQYFVQKLSGGVIPDPCGGKCHPFLHSAPFPVPAHAL